MTASLLSSPVKSSAVLLAGCLVTVGSMVAAPLYSESFEDEASAKVLVRKQSDAQATYVNYGSFVRDQPGGGGPVTISIPEAPNRISGSAATRGVILNSLYTTTSRIINLVAAQSPGGAEVSFSGDYRVAFDMFLSVDPAATVGTTEVGIFGIGHTGTDFVSYTGRAAGVGTYGWLSSDGGIGSTGDLALFSSGVEAFKKENLTDTGLFNLTFPQGVASPATGAFRTLPNNQWTQVEMFVNGGNVRLLLNGVFWGEALAAVTTGTAVIGYQDPFTGSTAGGLNREFGLFDNFVVESLAGVPVLEITPSLNFEPVEFPDATPAASYTVTNLTLTEDYQITGGTIDGQDAASFRVLNSPFPLAVGAGEQAFLDLGFNPSTPNGLKVARLTLTTTDPAQPVIYLPLQGRRAVDSVVAFLSTRVVSVSVEGGTGNGIVTVTNSSGSDVELSAPVIEGTDAAMFSVTGTFPLTVPVGDEVTLPVIFMPAGTPGLKNATVRIATTDPGVPQLSLALSARYAYGPPLLAHYKMDEVSGTSLADSSGASPAARLEIREAPFGFAQPSLLPGGAGTSVRFTPADGSTVGNFSVSNAVHLPDVSFALWIKPEFKAGNQRILNRSSLFGTTGTIYSLYLTDTGRLVFEVNSQIAAESLDDAILPDSVHHVAVTHRDEDAFGNVTGTRTRLFIDGVLVGEDLTDPALGYTDYTLTTTSAGLYIATATGAGQGYLGLMDDLQIYSVELTPDQIAGMHAQPGKTAFELEMLPFGVTSAVYNVAAGTFVLTWNSEPGKVYSVQQSTTTSGFTDVPGFSAVPSGGVSTSVTLTGVTGPRRFYQIFRAGQ